MERQARHCPHGQIHSPLGVWRFSVNVVRVFILGTVCGMGWRVITATAVGRLKVRGAGGAYGGRRVLHVLGLVFLFLYMGAAGAVLLHQTLYF